MTTFPSCRLLAVLFVVIAPAFCQGSPLRETPIVKAVRQAAPSVVNIHGRKSVPSAPTQPGTFGTSREVNGMGTGIVIDPRGYIITNHHVVDGVARIQVTMHDRSTHVARLVAIDRPTDLAIIRIRTPKPLPIIKFGTSRDLMPGETVIAVGNAYGYEHSVTKGIISALHRNVRISDRQHYNDLIQTDASINPGNSGGPLLNIDGDLIGINVAVRVGAQGIGFAMPVDNAVEIARRMVRKLNLKVSPHGLSGQIQIINDRRSFHVTAVELNSLAHQAGIQPGDTITSCNGRLVQTSLDIEFSMLDKDPGDRLAVNLVRSGTTRTADLALSSSLSTPHGISSYTWTGLGLRLKPVQAKTVSAVEDDYTGGLEVVAVRADSPAQNQGIKEGDVLLGLHKWETVSLNNLAFIFAADEFHQSMPVKFYIMRDRDTLFGTIGFDTPVGPSGN